MKLLCCFGNTCCWRKPIGFVHTVSLDRDEGIEREILQKPLNPAEIWEQRQMTELIYKGLSKLPVKQRQRIYAHFFLGMSKADIAKAEGTHKSRITRSIEAGLRSLEKYFKEIL